MFLFIGSCTKMMYEPMKEIVITIDDAPAFPENTIKILEVLDNHDVEATFFVVGYYIEIYPNLADTIAKYHIMANHTYSHPHLNEKSLSESYENEIEYTQMIIDGYNMKWNKPLNKYFRAPYSAITDHQQDSLRSLGYDIKWWDYDASDWDNNISVKQIINYHINSLKSHNWNKKPAVLIFHLSNNTIIALDEILKYCKENEIKVVNYKENIDYINTKY